MWVLAALLIIGGAALVWFRVARSDLWSLLESTSSTAALEIEHPIQGTVMPRNMPAPILLWKTNVAGPDAWVAAFKAGSQKWLFEGIQPRWRPSQTEWRGIKQAARGGPIELIVAGYEKEHPRQLEARGVIRFTVSSDAVEAPLFYREVNLPFKEAVKDPSHIRWRFGALDSGAPPPVVMQNLPVCGNCHSFSRNGEYLAMDVDYANDKGSYVITRTAPEMHLATSEIITWDDYRREDGQLTLGLLSQISPDGHFVLSTVKDLSVFMAKPDLAFSQLFFPFMGIVGVYDREAKRFFSLPGADDPVYVQSNPIWSPDGQWVVFARARAADLKGARASGRLLLEGQEAEAFLRLTKEFRYDLYRIPFNGGKGGTAQPLPGASANGRSNYFPKYSPDGRWIVFCQANSYMLLQPDSQLFIIPSEGGQARRLGCNLARMNSWHSWSPDGRWLVFSSKAHSDYTQLYLTRITGAGEASPPVWLDYLVGPGGYAANIPEFVNLPTNAIAKVREQFLDNYSYVRAAEEFSRAGDPEGAAERYRLALSMNPDNYVAHQKLGDLLFSTKHQKEALAHLQAAVRLEPHNPLARFHLGCALSGSGDPSNAIVQLEEGLRWVSKETGPQTGADKRALPEALHYNLGSAFLRTGHLTNAEHHYRAALQLAPAYAEAHTSLGTLLLQSGRLEEAAEHFAQTLKLQPQSAQAHNCLGIVRQRQNRMAEALACFQKATQCDPGDWQTHMNLANAYLSGGDRDKAIPELRETLRLAPAFEPARRALAKALQ